MGDAQMGPAGKTHVPGAAQTYRSISKSKTTVIFINQLRMKIGVFFGNPERLRRQRSEILRFATAHIRKMTSLKPPDVTGLEQKSKL